MTEAYEIRLRRVVQHIFDHPAGDLSLDALAEVAALSRFHFHRVYHAMTGETAAQAVRRIRAHRAAHWLLRTDWPLAQVAAAAGYDNAQSFARAFRGQFGLTPAAFRKSGRDTPPALTLRTGVPLMFPVTIAERPALRLAALPHRGAYHEIGKAFQQVCAVFSARQLWDQARGTVGVYYDSPQSVAEPDLRADAGIAVPEGFDLPSDLHETRLPGGRYAVMTVKGPYAQFPQAWDQLYCNWLPCSGSEPADSPPYEFYLNDPTDTAPAELLTEICVPLK
ncbi:AraC family transcriptional regulator [Thalassococcus sp. CAU 1522]|uniref:AraC family transcriptional regulator n=1 Tax=Thalassococcus arenae TaxID=2851652 RepID=A0ABS6N595_9RHOB|nr:AraC family transcriptional regulator [Thalassococcus arenae]MBV2358847.1 AraC family transcriptional regulator [Thalassococcus arenae]